MSKREDMKTRRHKSQKRERNMVIGIVAVFAVALAALIIYPYLKPAYKGLERPQARDNAVGDPNAPVKVEEFSDFQCPYCRMWSEENEAAFLEKYVNTGKVYFIYTPYSFLGQESVDAAEAAYCAMEQGKFWDYHDILFANQAGENGGAFSVPNLKQFARDLKLDTSKFNACMDGNKFTQTVIDNVTYGQSKGVNATPFFLINDTQLVDSTQVEAAVEAALNK